jgi:type II secretory pathway predicted ATPase ExeA
VEHLHHFQLSGDPFRNEPMQRLDFESAPQQDALRRLDRAVRQGRGLGVLIGATGSGKTAVVRQLLDDLEEEVFEASMMVVLDGAADAGWMLRRFCKQLGVEEPAAEREGLIGQIYEQLAIIREDGRQAVLIIDDAHTLARSGTLVEICGLLKLEYEDRRLLSLVLAGPPALDEAFRADSALAHRIDVRAHLGPFDREVSAAYLASRIQAVKGNPETLEGAAVTALFELGGGLPGRMNTLADNALFEAFLCGRSQVSRVDVERAHADLGWETLASLDTPGAAASTEAAPIAAAAATGSDPNEDTGSDFHKTLNQIDSELDSMLAPTNGPPKEDEDEPEDLLVELVELVDE